MGLEPTNLLIARLKLTVLTAINKSVKAQDSSAHRSLPLTIFGLFLAVASQHSLVPALVP
jgi:hypothetical protein